MVAVSHSECPQNSKPTGGVNSEPARCASAWPLMTTFGWLGFRIWQGIDLFRYAGQAEYREAGEPSPGYLLALTPESVNLLFSF